jgi:hypothetical protein
VCVCVCGRGGAWAWPGAEMDARCTDAGNLLAVICVHFVVRFQTLLRPVFFPQHSLSLCLGVGQTDTVAGPLV